VHARRISLREVRARSPCSSPMPPLRSDGHEVDSDLKYLGSGGGQQRHDWASPRPAMRRADVRSKLLRLRGRSSLRPQYLTAARPGGWRRACCRVLPQCCRAKRVGLRLQGDAAVREAGACMPLRGRRGGVRGQRGQARKERGAAALETGTEEDRPYRSKILILYV